MSVYELPTQINNEIVLKKIKELQDQLKPEINPIIQKILPLPYEINKIILDKLNIQKKIYMEETHIKKRLSKFINVRLSYWNIDILPLDTMNNNMDLYIDRKKENLETDIRTTTPLDHYWIGRFETYRNLVYTIYCSGLNETYEKEFENYEFDFYKKEMIKSIKDMNILFTLWNDIQEKLIHTLGHIENNINPYRCNKEITINNELETKTFKIFKSNGSINSKQYNSFLQFVGEYVYRKKCEIIENVNYQILQKYKNKFTTITLIKFLKKKINYFYYIIDLNLFFIRLKKTPILKLMLLKFKINQLGKV